MSPSNGGVSTEVEKDNFIIGRDDRILVTGASGFIGPRVVASLLDRGFRRIRCFARSSSGGTPREHLAGRADQTSVQWFKGNLLSRQDCEAATEGVAVVL